MPCRGAVGAAVTLAGCLLLHAPDAGAVIMLTSNAGDLAQAMAQNPAQVTGASFVDHYRATLKAYGAVTRADADMRTHFLIGKEWTSDGPWSRTATGWLLR